MKKPLLDPKSDPVFKQIFGENRNLDILQNFLQSVLDLPPEEYRRLELADPFLKGSGPDEKMSILDIKVHTASGIIIDVEIQLWNDPDMKERMVWYLAKMIAGQ